MDTKTIYTSLCREFSETYQLKKGGTELDYLSGEQVVTRLNDVLGMDGWDFRALGNGRDDETIWVHGQLTVYLASRTITREQFGECQITRGMAVGDARKGATTDALKKCATLIGVGLYLSRKEETTHAERESAPAASKPKTNGVAAQHQPPPAPTPQPQPQSGGETLICEVCAEPLTETQFRDGTAWSPAQLAGYGRRKHSRTLCMAHYREANDARKRQEASGEDVAF